MSNQKISAYPGATTLTGAEILLGDQGSPLATVTILVSAVRDYVLTQLGTAEGVVTPSTGAGAATPTTGDYLPAFRLVGSTLTPEVYKLADVATYVLAQNTFTGLTAEGTPAGTDLLEIQRSGSLGTILVSALATFAINSGSALTPGTPTFGDEYLFYRGGAAGIATIDNLGTYLLDSVWGVSAVTSFLSTDYVLGIHSSAGQKITMANLETQLTTDLQAGILTISGLSSAGALSDADLYLVSQSGSPKKVTLGTIEALVFSDFTAYATGLSDITTLSSTDQFYMVHGSTPHYATALEISTYTLGNLLAVTSEASWLTGDSIFFNRVISGTPTIVQCTIDEIMAYAAVAVSQLVLNISTLSTAASLAATNWLLVCQSETPVNTLLGPAASNPFTSSDKTLTNYIMGQYAAYVEVLAASPIGSTAGTDVFWCLQGGTTPKAVTAAMMATYFASAALGVAGISLTLPQFSSNNAPVTATASFPNVGAYDVVTVAGSNGNTSYGVKLLTGVAGQSITVIETAGYPLKLYPATGGTLSGLSANTPVTIAAKHIVLCKCTATNTWYVADLGAALAT
jgi:hypothetical protein